jgi:hypothetical protein
MALSTAGEKGILIKKDASGLTAANDVLDIVPVFDETLGRITLSRFFNNASKLSNPVLSADTGFVAEFKLTANSGVSVSDQDIIKATTAIFSVPGPTGFVHDEITAAGLDSGTVSFVPVELASFSSIIIGDNDLKLTWVTVSETNNLGFYVERSNDGVSYETIGFVDGSGTSTEEITYSLMDEALPAGNYSYRLRQVDFNGM